MNVIPFERSYWVIPNKLIAGEIPAAKTEEESRLKLDGLLGINTNVVINLMEEEERNHDNQPFFDYAKILNNENVETFRLPIKDVSIPTKENMIKILDLIDQAHSNDKIVYVHCWGGVGRTGTVIGCYLIRHGLANRRNVFQTIDYLKRTTTISGRMSPETEEQKSFVLAWNLNQ